MKIARLGLASLLGVATTCALLVLMVTLIDMGNVEVVEKNTHKIADIWQEEQQIEDQVKQRKPEKLDEPEEPPPPLPQDNLDVEDVADAIQIAAPNLNAKASISIGGFGGDGEYIPLVKIQPQYPRRAQERGIEGYVIVEFTITTTGAIRDPVVVEGFTSKGKPTTVFNRAGIKAAMKLKYKPRVVDGEPVEVPGVPHRFTFQLEK